MLKNRVLGVSGSGLQLAQGGSQTNAVFRQNTREQVTAGLGLYEGSQFGGTNVSMNTLWSSEYQYMLTGLLNPATPDINDHSGLALFFRDIYKYDNTSGSVVDILSTFPFSEFELRGLTAAELKPFEEAVTRLNLKRMMPLASQAYLTDGFFCGSLIYDPLNKTFLDTFIHDALNCKVQHVQWFNGPPEITVKISNYARRLLSTEDAYTRRYLNMLPQKFLSLLERGIFNLEPMATLYVPRRVMTDSAYVSYLHRIIPMYLIEKAMFRGTLTEAHKRQRSMTHLTAGDDVWTPTTEELGQLVSQFQTAEYDPLGGWVATRNAVQSTDLRPAGDFWKWTDMVDIMVQYKLRALGVSEAFLTADAQYSNQDQAISAFLESQQAFRDHMTEQIFYEKIFPLVAATHKLYKDEKLGKLMERDASQFLFNPVARQGLKIPEVYWHKQLTSDEDEGQMELLSQLDERGVPIPLKMWITAAKLDPDTLIRELEDDTEFRKVLENYTGKDTSHDAEVDDFDSDSIEAHIYSVNHGRGPKRPLLSRDFGGDKLLATTTRTGKKKHIINQTKAKKDLNWKLVKSAKALQDPNYRLEMKKRNIEQFGSATMPVGLPNRKFGKL